MYWRCLRETFGPGPGQVKHGESSETGRELVTVAQGQQHRQWHTEKLPRRPGCLHSSKLLSTALRESFKERELFHRNTVGILILPAVLNIVKRKAVSSVSYVKKTSLGCPRREGLGRWSTEMWLPWLLWQQCFSVSLQYSFKDIFIVCRKFQSILVILHCILHSKHKELIKTVSVYYTWLSALPGTNSWISFFSLSLRISDIINGSKICSKTSLLWTAPPFWCGQQIQQWKNSGLWRQYLLSPGGQQNWWVELIIGLWKTEYSSAWGRR